MFQHLWLAQHAALWYLTAFVTWHLADFNKSIDYDCKVCQRLARISYWLFMCGGLVALGFPAQLLEYPFKGFVAVFMVAFVLSLSVRFVQYAVMLPPDELDDTPPK
jgi:hypothetical protein